MTIDPGFLNCGIIPASPAHSAGAKSNLQVSSRIMTAEGYAKFGRKFFKKKEPMML
jgi:hypothetical protein